MPKGEKKTITRHHGCQEFLPAVFVDRIQMPKTRQDNSVTFPKQSGSPGAVVDEVAEGAENLPAWKIKITCLCCDKDFISYKREKRKFCSPKCHYTYVRGRPFHNQQSKNKISVAVKERWETDIDFRTKMSGQIGEKNPMYGKHHTEETKQKHGDIIRKKWQDPEWRQEKGVNVSLFKKKQIPWNLGISPTPETKMKISQSLKGRKNPKKVHTSKVLQTAEELVKQGHKIVFIDDNTIRPDIVTIKDNCVYQIEVERKNGNNGKKKQSPHCDKMLVIYF